MMLEHRKVQQDNGFGIRGWSMAKEKDVTIGAETANDGGTRRRVNG